VWLIWCSQVWFYEGVCGTVSIVYFNIYGLYKLVEFGLCTFFSGFNKKFDFSEGVV
jgi:hypothetical protein